MIKEVSPKGLVEVLFSEAIVTGPYYDSVGILTLGGGHTAAAGPPNPLEFPMGVPVPLDVLLGIYARDVRTYERRTAKAMTGPTTQTEFDAGFSFDVNTGAINRASWVQTHNSGVKSRAADQIMNWVKPPELKTRRLREQRLYRDGIYESDGRVTVCPASATGSPLYRQGKLVNVLPAMTVLRDSISSDTKADKHITKGTAAVVVDAATTPSTMTIPDVGDFANAKWFAIAAVVALAVFALYSLFQVIRHKMHAKVFLHVAADGIRAAFKQTTETPNDSGIASQGGHISSLGPSGPEQPSIG